MTKSNMGILEQGFDECRLHSHAELKYDDTNDSVYCSRCGRVWVS